MVTTVLRVVTMARITVTTDTVRRGQISGDDAFKNAIAGQQEH